MFHGKIEREITANFDEESQEIQAVYPFFQPDGLERAAYLVSDHSFCDVNITYLIIW